MDENLSNFEVIMGRRSPYLKTPHKVNGMILANHTGIHHVNLS